jgi:hypothetical protein
MHPYMGHALRMAAWLISHHSHTAKGYSRF